MVKIIVISIAYGETAPLTKKATEEHQVMLKKSRTFSGTGQERY